MTPPSPQPAARGEQLVYLAELKGLPRAEASRRVKAWLERFDAVEWARECARLGAGEILLTSVDRDGARTGYDLELTAAVADAVTVPVIASGGAGTAAHVRAALIEGRADAALVAGILHDGTTTVRALKDAMRAAQIPVREVAA